MITPMRVSRHRGRRARGIAPLELLLVFPVLLVLGVMIMCFQMVMMRSAHRTMEARSAAWARKGGAIEADESLVVQDIEVMSPMLPNGGDLTKGIIHDVRSQPFQMSIGYFPRTVHIEEHHFLLDDCWNHERLTQYRGHGRLRPEPFMLRFIAGLLSQGRTAFKFLPPGFMMSQVFGIDLGALGGGFGSLASIPGIPTAGFAQPGPMASGLSQLTAMTNRTLELARQVKRILELAKDFLPLAEVIKAIDGMISGLELIGELRSMVGV